VLGFYSLVLSSLVPMSIVGRIGRKFGKKREIPAVYLAAVATHTYHERAGVGAKLMLDALKRTLEIADRAGTACMTLDAVDEERALWYERLDFERFGTTSDGKIQMYLPIWKIEDAIPRDQIAVCV
jgi:predicted N-acetyltransferase YhbS